MFYQHQEEEQLAVGTEIGVGKRNESSEQS